MLILTFSEHNSVYKPITCVFQHEHKEATLQNYAANRMCLGREWGSGEMSTSPSLSLRKAGVHHNYLLPAIICWIPYQEISCLSHTLSMNTVTANRKLL